MNVGRGAMVTMSMRLLSLGTSFLTSIMLARALGAEGKGAFALLLQIPALVVTLFSFGMATANAYFVGRRQRTVGEAVADSLAVIAVATLAGVPLSALVSVIIPGLARVDPGVMLLAALAVPLSLVTLALTGVLTGLGRVESLAARQTAGAVLGLVFVMSVFALGTLTVQSAVVIALLGNAVAVALLFGAVWPELKTSFTRPSLRRVREAAGYAGKAYLGGIAGFMDKRQDILLLGVLGTTAGVGVYSIGVTFSELLWQISGSISGPLMARSLQETESAGARVAARTSRIVAALMTASALLLGLAVWLLLPVLYGAEFARATQVYALLAPGIVVYGVGSVLWNYMMTHGRLFPRLAVLVALLNLAGNLVLIPTLGIRGAALASTLSYSVGGVALIAAFIRMSGCSVAETLILRRDDYRTVRASLTQALGTRHARPLRVAFVGFDRFWPDILAEGLNARFADQMSCRVIVQGSGLTGVPGYLRALRTSDVVVRVGAGVDLASRMDRTFFSQRWRTRNGVRVLYWIGTDVLRATRALRDGLMPAETLEAIRSVVNIAGAQHLADELTEAGIPATTVWFPAGKLTPPEQPEPLPSQFRVLTYMPSGTEERFRFYGGVDIAEAASALPDVDFAIMGISDSPMDLSPNVTLLGRVEDPRAEYDRSTVVVRLIEHDAIGGTMIEGLMHARHVLYSYEFPHTEQVAFGDAVGLIEALKRYKTQHDAGTLNPNAAGRAWVLERYDPGVRFEHVRDALLAIAGRTPGTPDPLAPHDWPQQ